ncbi:MAG TPA: hypothetical protein VLT45_16355 [Kofleriaceae bacterium]|nr:hypothetical protein [Kofleriaceae bacterium]
MRLTAIVVLGALARVAQADDTADSLFEEGVKLREAGKNADACVKFRESYEKNKNAVGTILNVALCNEEEGKIASAHKLYAEAAARAKEQKLEDHEKAAEEHKDKLAGDVPRLSIAFTDVAPDTKLAVGDELVDTNSASDIEVDPGDIKVVVSAPNRVPYVTHVSVGKGEHKLIAIPKLGLPVEDTGRATLGKVITISGGGVLLVAIGVGYLAHKKYDDQFSSGHCTMKDAATPLCDQTGYRETGSAKTLGWVGTGIGAAGLVAVGVGVTLWLTAPHHEAARGVSFAPTLAPGEGGVVAFGRF